MLHNLKKNLFEILIKIDKNIMINIDDIEVETLFDQRGDFTTNTALKFSKIYNLNPKQLANLIIKNLNINDFEKVEMAGPGFINFTLKDETFNSQLINNKIEFKNSDKVNIEFVSANPTGPLHLAHGRGAVVGDILSNLFEYFGHKVTREYYVNNTGNQINEFLSSILYSISNKNNLSLDENQFYKGDYINDIANNCYKNFKSLFSKELSPSDRINIVNFAIENLVNQTIQTLSSAGINFDEISYETNIMEKEYLPLILEKLNKSELTYKGQLNAPKDYTGTQKDNDLTIFKSTLFNDDEDRALTKNDGSPTYFANDIAYHEDKYQRGYNKLINIWGADHLGYLKRLSSAITSLHPEIDFSVVFCQIVNLKRDNKIQKLSKREGNIFELKNLIKEIGVDNFRYFMSYRKNDTHMDLDIDLIKKENKENPIYYIQYSYARTQSVLNKTNKIIDTQVLVTSELKNLYKKLLEWENVIKSAYQKKEVHLIAHYLESLSSYFHTLWSSSKNNPKAKFLDKDSNISSDLHKLLCNYQNVLKDGLKILGIKPKLQM
ncbi:arginine--tRNA ligase [Alphaproteobacteria bacterium]|nr:arginine--tRNA ligase [Alphaproteobacteria bacterium]